MGVKSPYSSFGSLSVAGGKLVTVGGSPTRPSEVAVLDFKSDIATAGSEQWTSLKRAIDVDVRLSHLCRTAGMGMCSQKLWPAACMLRLLLVLHAC